MKQYPLLVIQTWLKLQKFKADEDEELDIGSFYHEKYDFPTYDDEVKYEYHTIPTGGLFIPTN